MGHYDEQIWQHNTQSKINLMQGDCLKRMNEIPDGSVDMILTDPPYGTTACKWDSIIPLEPMWEQLKRVIKPNGAIVMTASQPFTSVLTCSNLKMFKHQWVWHKNCATAFQSAKYRPLQGHEDVLVFGSCKVTYNPQITLNHKPTNSAKSCKQAGIYQGDSKWEYEGGKTTRYPTTVQKFNIERGLHPTQKPVALMEYLIKTYTNEGETVLDFTMGSGSTGVAAKNLNRNFIGIELDETYFNIAKERINNS
jgi:site-specific DNA-methyltransferase (adenine-specific)